MRKLTRENICVEVVPALPFYGENTEEKRIAACRELERAIKRHCDGIGQVTVVYLAVWICSHCGSRWTEPSDTYNGGCCDADESNKLEPTDA